MGNVQGRNCELVLRNGDEVVDLPYAVETIREAAFLLAEEAAIEGDGNRGAIRLRGGTTGCIVTPLTCNTVPVLLALALGRGEDGEFVTGTRNLYSHRLLLNSLEKSPWFDLVQRRGNGAALFEHCRVSGFELRIMRGEAIKLRLDIRGNIPPGYYPYEAREWIRQRDRFRESGVRYVLNGNDCTSIYGLTIGTEKKKGNRTEVRIHRVLREGEEFPPVIESFCINALVLRKNGEAGLFRINLGRLLMMGDETSVDSPGAVIGPLRYYCAGDFTATAYTEDNRALV